MDKKGNYVKRTLQLIFLFFKFVTWGFVDIKPIKIDADYQAALKEVEGLIMARPDTPEGEKLGVIITIIKVYEAKHFPMGLP